MIIAFVLGTAFGATAVLLWCACAVNNKTTAMRMLNVSCITMETL